MPLSATTPYTQINYAILEQESRLDELSAKEKIDKAALDNLKMVTFFELHIKLCTCICNAHYLVHCTYCRGASVGLNHWKGSFLKVNFDIFVRPFAQKLISIFYFCMKLPKDGTKPLDKDGFY